MIYCNTPNFEFLEIELKWFNLELCAHENIGKIKNFINLKFIIRFSKTFVHTCRCICFFELCGFDSNWTHSKCFSKSFICLWLVSVFSYNNQTLAFSTLIFSFGVFQDHFLLLKIPHLCSASINISLQTSRESFWLFLGFFIQEIIAKIINSNPKLSYLKILWLFLKSVSCWYWSPRTFCFDVVAQSEDASN